MPNDIADRVQWRIMELSEKYPTFESALKNLKLACKKKLIFQ